MQKELFTEDQAFCQTAVSRSAVISDCGNYRYQLSRIWDEKLPMMLFIMLNPSKADANKDDPTIRRCITFAKSWGFGGFYVCNLFAFRATKPADLLAAEWPHGDENTFYIRQTVEKVETIVCAWGNSVAVRKLLKKESPFRLIGLSQKRMQYLKLSKDGTPWHPLFVKGDVVPKHFG